MGKHFDSIPPEAVDWVKKQKVFWVATAPLDAEGHVNVSPKGVEGTFHLIDENSCWYEDLTGSGIETIAHLQENQRITIMFCAFEGPPRIVRFWGKGEVYEVGTPEYDSFIPKDHRKPGSRAVIKVNIHKVGFSCGYSVPFFTFDRYRTQLEEHFARKELQDLADRNCRAQGGVLQYWTEKNMKSIDGMAGLNCAQDLLEDPKKSFGKGYIGAGEAQYWTAEAKTKRASNSKLLTARVSLAITNLLDAKLVGGFALGVATVSLYRILTTRHL